MIYKRNRLEKKKNKAKKAKPRGNHHHFKSIKPRTPRREMKKKKDRIQKKGNLMKGVMTAFIIINDQ